MTACHAGPADVALAEQAIVYGSDGRREVFELDDPAVRERVARSVFAIIPRTSLIEHADRLELSAPSRVEGEGACPDEPFGHQPAAALCSGVLVDWDLVLTAGHCIRVPRLDDYVIVLGYYYRAPEQLALAHDDVFELADVVAEATEREGGRTTLDYAFVRLDRSAGRNAEPAPIRTAIEAIAVGTEVIAAGASESLPIKVDDGGLVRRTRLEARAHFVADTDTFKGGSGGPAFDVELALLGVLARGGEDWADDGGCLRARNVLPEQADEHYTYAGRALADLCARHPEATTLCRPSCGEPCRALAPPAREGAGCAAAGARAGATSWPASPLFALAALRWRRRQRALSTPLRCP